ncbi:MAG: hypothetical protein ACYDG2_26850 [Ruminiclostridium sp.]
MLSRLDFLILALLEANSAKSALTGMSVNEISQVEVLSAEITLYKRLKLLLNLNYVAKGYKTGKAETYYITDKGLQIKLQGEKSI